MVSLLKLFIEHMANRSSSIQIELKDEAASEAFGIRLAKALERCSQTVRDRGFNIRMVGELGAGKTFITRAMLRALGYGGRVKSPTFTLLETYPVDGFQLNHFDFYRFEEPQEFEEAGFRDSFGPGFVTVVEWADKAGGYLPDSDLAVTLKVTGEGRNATIEAMSEEAQKFLLELGQ